MVDAHFHHAAQQRPIGKIAARGDVEIVAENVAEIRRLAARPLQRRLDAPDQKRQRLAQVPEDDLQLRIFLEHAGEDEPNAERRGLHRIARVIIGKSLA